MSQQFKYELSDSLIGKAVSAYPDISPRDIKMLLRLSIRVATGQDKPMDIDLIRQCAMFRGM